VQVHGYLVDGVGVLTTEHRIGCHGAEERDLVFQGAGNVLLGATDQHIGLNAQGPQFLDAVLGGFGFQFARGLDVGHVGEVHVEGVAQARFNAELADGFQEGLTLDIAHGAADLHDHHIHILGDLLHNALDLIRDVRDHLHGFAQIVPPTFFLDHRVVDAA